MNRIDRLFAITTYLQSRDHVRAVDLARRFEVSLRTIYRDMTALSESGVPIISLPGQGYALADGFFLPPLHLTTDEAVALILGARLLSASASLDLANAAREATTKIRGSIDERTRRRLAEISSSIDVSAAPVTTLRIDLGNETIVALNRAILERRVVSLRYFGRNRAEITVRDVEPSRLSYVNGAWYLTAYCQVRRGERAFRLDRIESFSVQAAQFHPGAVAPSPHPPPLEVMVRFAPPASRWAQERQHWSFTAATQNNGDLVATYHPHSLEEIEHWILGWGSSAEVISPPELRDRLRREAQRIARMLT